MGSTTLKQNKIDAQEGCFDTVIVRYGGEIGIKSEWTRKLYERRLLANIKSVLKHRGLHPARFVRIFGRLYIDTRQTDEVTDALRRVFGISSLSPALKTTSSIGDIITSSVNVARLNFERKRAFAVLCRRVGNHPYTSQDVCRQVGHSILARLPQMKLHVNLDRPDQTINVEAREDRAYVFTDVTRAAGGLPLGTQPKTICLLKGDAASTVACWMTMKRGCPPVLVHLDDTVSARKPNVLSAVDSARTLMEWSVGFPTRLRIVQYDSTFKRGLGSQTLELKRLLCKRLLLRLAQTVANQQHAEAMVVGDSLAPSENQSLHTIGIQDEAIQNYPVLRPLLGLDREEVREVAKIIGAKGTLIQEDGKKVKKRRGSTATMDLEDIRRFEKRLNTDKIVEHSLRNIKIVDLELQTDS